MNKSLIKICNVSISHSQNQILEDINLEINQGDFIYIIGGTGSGKSTLLKSLYKEVNVDKGKIEILNFNLENIRKKEIPFLRRKIGIIFQDMHLLSDRNVYKNLEFVLESTGWKNKKEMRLRIEEVLNSVHLEDMENKMPFELSGGEQQRVSIARSILNHPQIIIADEPTGNLDPERSQKIIEIMQEINKKGTTIIIATHDYSIIDKFPKRTYRVENRTINQVM